MKNLFRFSILTLALLLVGNVMAEDYSGLYRLKSRYNRYAQENASTHAMSTATALAANDLKQLWIVEKSGTKYTIRNANSGRYVPADGGSDAALITVTAPTSLYIKASAYSDKYLTISWSSNFTGSTCLHDNSRHNVVKWFANNADNENEYSDWQLVSLSASDTVTNVSIRKHLGEKTGLASEITTGYYRFVSVGSPDYSMAENTSASNVVAKLTRDDDYTQFWKVNVNNDTMTIQNAISGNYLRNNVANNIQIRTISTDDNNTFTASLSELSKWEPAFTFKGRYTGFACNASNFKVVGGVPTMVNSAWKLLRVEVDSATLADARIEVMDVIDITKNYKTYNTKLQKFFSDYACTTLRDEYAAMTEEQLRDAMAADEMPVTLQNMAACVLTDKWDADPKRSKYTKMFRIQDVQIYSDNVAWKKITTVGPWGELINPTGIQGKAGDVVFIYADNTPLDDDATLKAQLAYDTEYRNRGTMTLKQGLNVWTLPADGEIFIGYTLNNTNRYLNEYPNIRIHIERGTVNGYWDMSRGMTNTDWKWLRENMFKGTFLHVKGNSTVLNTLRANVVGANDVTNIMRGWDFSFEKLEYLIGNDGQWDGRYRPVANPRHSYKDNPNWASYGGSNHPNISSGYLFNFDNFYEGNVWEILHELGHGHQYPIQVAGTTEITNNSLSQMVSYMMGRCYSRGDGTEKLMQLFNYEANGLKNWTWTDFTRSAKPFYDASLHVANHLFYQLYLYFDVLGNDPDFTPRLCDEMRANPIVTGSRVTNPTYYYNDYWLLAKACAKVSQTDLWEFFEAYGFWKYYDDVISTREEDNSEQAIQNGIRFIGDYGGYYMKMPVRGNADDERRLQELKEYMHSMPKKASNILFLDDRINASTVRSNCFAASVKRSLVGKPLLHYWDLPSQGDFGHYTNFDGKDRSANLGYTIGTTIDSMQMTTSSGGDTNYQIYGRTVSMQGSGILGIKIYDNNGKLCHIANTRKFIVPEQIAEGLEDGTYKLHVAILAGEDVELGANGKPTGINAVESEGEQDANAPVRDLQGRIVTQTIPGNIYIKGKTKFIAK